MNNSDPYTRYWAFNVSKMPCLEIRAAMYFSYDFKAMLDYDGGPKFAGSHATGTISPLLATDYAPTKVIGPGSPDFKESGNVAKAQSYMDTAKTKCAAEYTRVTTTGVTIDVPQSATLNDTIPIMQAAYARVGIKANFNIIASGYYSTINTDKQNDLSSGGWGADWANASTVLPELYASFGGWNLSKNQADPAVKGFSDRAQAAISETDRAKQAKLLKALDKEAARNFWSLPTKFGKAQEVWGSGLQNVFFWVPQGNPAYGKIWIKK